MKSKVKTITVAVLLLCGFACTCFIFMLPHSGDEWSRKHNVQESSVESISEEYIEPSQSKEYIEPSIVDMSNVQENMDKWKADTIGVDTVDSMEWTAVLHSIDMEYDEYDNSNVSDIVGRYFDENTDYTVYTEARNKAVDSTVTEAGKIKIIKGELLNVFYVVVGDDLYIYAWK